ncbi:MAG TPA: hypothetical protein VNT51_00225 [Miltoncostaeaceae bacterium]|nr:hypothetical protein [Miltoncostaeaceae bacterium]
MRRTRKTPLAAIAASAVLALGVAACGDDENSGSGTTGTTTAMSTMGHGDMAAAPTNAADLRVTLDRLLGEHAFLATVAMQKGLDGADDFRPAAAALDRNSVELADAIGSVYGPEARQAFLVQWRQHIGFFVDYTVATAQKDAAGKRKALADLDAYTTGFAGFLAQANPNLERDGVAGLLTDHVQQLRVGLDSYAAGNHQRAYAQAREAYGHMFMTGDGLAAAIAQQYPDRFAAPDSAEATELRVTLNRLLGEHALLATLAMQKGLDGADDFDAVAAALDRNSVELADAIGSVYGPEARQAFLAQWRQHIGFFVDYTVATAKKDEAGKREALTGLEGYTQGFSQFLASANPNLDAEELQSGLAMHVEQLRTAIDHYDAGRHAAAYTAIREAHTHMFGTGDALAGAIATQFPEKFGS